MKSNNIFPDDSSKFNKIIDLFSKIGNKLNLDLTYFATNSLYGLIQQVIGSVCGIILTYLLGHFVSQTIFGEYNLILSIIGLFTFLSLPGLNTALTQAAGRGYDGALIQSAKLKFVFSLLGIPCLLLYALYYFLHGNRYLAQVLSVAAVSFPLLYTFTNYSFFLTAKRRFTTITILSSLSSIFFLILLSTVIFVSPATLSLTLGFIIATIIPSFVSFWFSLKFVANKKPDPELPHYGFFLTLVQILPWVSGYLGNIILAFFLHARALAIFTVASSFYIIAQQSFMVFYKPITGKLVTQNVRGHLDTLAKHASKLVLLGAFLAGSLWLVVPWLISFFYKSSYQVAVNYAQWLSLVLLPMPIAWVLADMLIYQKKKKPQIFVSIVPPVVKILLFLVLIPKWGIGGLVAVVLLEKFVSPLISLFVLLRD